MGILWNTSITENDGKFHTNALTCPYDSANRTVELYQLFCKHDKIYWLHVLRLLKETIFDFSGSETHQTNELREKSFWKSSGGT